MVRVSGPAARDLVRSLAPGLPDPLSARHAYLTTLLDPTSGAPVDQGLLTFFRGPASFTGEDSFEFSGHGGEVAANLVLEAVLAAGARPAERGEFTRRAVANGRLDLLQAEALGDLIEGNGRVLHRTALRQLERHLSERVSEIRDELVELEAVLSHHIDFPDEDDAPVPSREIAGRAAVLAGRLAALARTAPEGRRLRSGAMVVLAGRPNAGKSSLYNALVGEERAIVTDLPGTTRDALEADIAIEGFPIRLVDTAGLGEAGDRVERLGIEVARRFVEHADLLLYCVTCDREILPDEREWLEGRSAPVLVVRTKADTSGREGLKGLRVSSVSGLGLDALRGEIVSRVFGLLRSLDEEVPVLLRARQAEAVARAGVEVERFAALLDDGVPAELATTHLRAAESALEELVGLIDPEVILDRLFSSFCIGK